MPFRCIADQLKIGVGTAHKLFKKFEDTGDVVPKTYPAKLEWRKLDDLHELYIIGLVAENPGLYLREMCQKIYDATGVRVSDSTLCRTLRRNGFSRKKIVQVAKQRSAIFRGKFMADVLGYPRSYFVWVDESGSDRRNQIRKFGYSLIGVEPMYHRFLSRGVRYSAISAISSSGMICYELVTGSVNGDMYYDFLRGTLVPNMQPFPNDMSILIMDNCSIHHVEEIRDLLTSVGVLVIYLPPYSPDYNPIELVFSYIKYFLKDHDDIIKTANNFKAILSCAFDSVTSQQCNAYINHSGYSFIVQSQCSLVFQNFCMSPIIVC
jgi:transposase